MILVHFRRSFDELNQAERRLAGLRLWDYLEPIVVISVGGGVGIVRIQPEDLRSPGCARDCAAFAGMDAEIEEVLERQREAMAPRLFPDMPPHKYLCFYPMDRRRGEDKNWYRLPMAERQRQMHEHGMVGRSTPAR